MPRPVCHRTSAAFSSLLVAILPAFPVVSLPTSPMDDHTLALAFVRSIFKIGSNLPIMSKVFDIGKFDLDATLRDGALCPKPCPQCRLCRRPLVVSRSRSWRDDRGI